MHVRFTHTMGTRWSSVLATVVAVSGVLMIGGCASTTCSAVLFADAVVVHFDSSAPTADLTTVQACIGGNCEQNTVDPTHADLRIPVAVGSGSVKVSVAGRSGAGQQLFQGSTTVTPVLNQPDGPGCQSVHVADVTVTSSGLYATGN